jgi:hypothetical protein
MVYNPWLKLGYGAFQLGLEAQSVVALRLMKLTVGDAAAVAESQLMVSEKITAAMVASSHLAIGLMSGSGVNGARKAQAHYRKAVRANRRRLTKR